MTSLRRFFPCLFITSLLLATVGCAGKPFQIRNIAKSDIDMVTDTHIQQLYEHCRQLMIKLYKRNPRQLAKQPGATVQSRLRQLDQLTTDFRFKELNQVTGNQAIRLAFSDGFRGDRVFALMVGLRSMLFAAYNQKTELFMLDDLDQQKLYNSARNLEIVAWRLNNHRHPDGSLYLLSNGSEDGISNRSFERLLGKMISIQDMMAKIIAGKTNRTINTVIHSVASSTLLPIGI